MKHGIEDVMGLREDIPWFMTKFQKHDANPLHLGAGHTPGEALQNAKLGDQGWVRHKKAAGIKVASCPTRGEHTYSKLRTRFIMQEYPGRWEFENDLAVCEDALRLCEKYGTLDSLMGFLQDDYHVLHPASNTMAFSIIIHMHKEMVYFADAHQLHVLQTIFRVCLKVALPSVALHNTSNCLFPDGNVVAKLLSRFHAPIGGAFVARTDVAREPASKKPRLGSKATTPSLASAPFEPTLPVQGATGERPVEVLDDFVIIMFRPLAGLPMDQVNWGEVDAGLLRLIKVMCGHPTLVHGDETTKYKTLVREDVYMSNVAVHSAALKR